MEDSDLERLRIPSAELEDIVDLETLTSLTLDFYQAFAFKNRRKLFSALLTEFFILIVVLIFIMPVSLIVLKNVGNLANTSSQSSQILLIIVGVALLGMLGLNLYLWSQVKKRKSLAVLINKVEQHNGVISALQILQQLESSRSSSQQFHQSHDRQEILEALEITQQSLIDALKIETIIRKHQNLMYRPYELLADLEQNLTNLMTFDPKEQTSEYDDLLNSAVEIGMSVHREVKKLKKIR